MASDGIAWCFAHNADPLDLQFRGWLSKKFIHSNQTQMHFSGGRPWMFCKNFGRRLTWPPTLVNVVRVLIQKYNPRTSEVLTSGFNGSSYPALVLAPGKFVLTASQVFLFIIQ